MQHSIHSFIIFTLQSLTQYQIYHWQVEGPGSFAAHKAFDEYNAAMKPLIDALAESFQGRFNERIVVTDSRRPLNIAQESPIEFTDRVLERIEDSKSLFENYSDLANIVDEMIAETTKLKYLLTLS